MSSLDFIEKDFFWYSGFSKFRNKTATVDNNGFSDYIPCLVASDDTGIVISFNFPYQKNSSSYYSKLIIKSPFNLQYENSQSIIQNLGIVGAFDDSLFTSINSDKSNCTNLHPENTYSHSNIKMMLYPIQNSKH